MGKKTDVTETEVPAVEVVEEVPVVEPPCTCSEDARHRGDELRKQEKVARELASAGAVVKRWD